MSDFQDCQISAARYCVGFPEADPSGLLQLVDSGITPETFRVYSSSRGLVQTAAGVVFGVARDYFFRYGVLPPPIACIELVTAAAPEVLAGEAAALIPQLQDLPYEPQDLPRLIDTLKTYARQARTFGEVASAVATMRSIDDLDTAVDRLVSSLSQLRETDPRGAPYTTISDLGSKSVEHMRHIREHPERARGLMTGIAGFDMDTLGLHPGELLLLVGEEKSGKSTVMLHIARTMHEHGHSPAIALHEMSVEVEARRYAAMMLHGVIDDPHLMLALKSGALSNEQFAAYCAMWESVREAAGELFLIHPHKCRTIDQLEAAVADISRKRQISCLMVDAGQRKGVAHTSVDAYSPQYQRVVVERCMTLALRYQFPLVVEIQTTRGYDPKTGLDVIGQSKAWGEACAYALLIERQTGLQVSLRMIGTRDAAQDSVYPMLIDPDRMYVVNAPRQGINPTTTGGDLP